MSVIAEEKRNYFAERIDWKKTSDTEYPYQTMFEGRELLLRLNDFPDEPLYTLIADGEEAADYEDWSPFWSKEQKAAVLYGVAD